MLGKVLLEGEMLSQGAVKPTESPSSGFWPAVFEWAMLTAIVAAVVAVLV